MPTSTTSQFGYFPEYSGVTVQGLSTVSSSANVKDYAVSAATMTGDEVLTTAILGGGMIQRDASGSPRNLQLPTASDLAMGLGTSVTGQAVPFVIQNTSSGANALTVTVNTGATHFRYRNCRPE